MTGCARRSIFSEELRSFRTLISLIGEDDFDERKSSPDATVQHRRRAVTVLNANRVSDDPHHQSERIDEHMALAALDLLARVIAASVGFTDRPSMTPAVGPASRPAASRSAR